MLISLPLEEDAMLLLSDAFEVAFARRYVAAPTNVASPTSVWEDHFCSCSGLEDEAAGAALPPRGSSGCCLAHLIDVLKAFKERLLLGTRHTCPAEEAQSLLLLPDRRASMLDGRQQLEVSGEGDGQWRSGGRTAPADWARLFRWHFSPGQALRLGMSIPADDCINVVANRLGAYPEAATLIRLCTSYH